MKNRFAVTLRCVPRPYIRDSVNNTQQFTINYDLFASHNVQPVFARLMHDLSNLG